MNKRYHTKLANYFKSQVLFFDDDKQKQPNIRKCVEQPLQQTKAELWNDVTETLCDLDFIQAKSVAKQTYNLINDYNLVLEYLPENLASIEDEHKRQARLDKYTQDLIAYAKNEINKLKVPESITPWTQNQINTEKERIKTNPTRLDKIKDFYNFLGQEANNLQNYSHEFAYFSIQQAWNYSFDGLVKEAAIKQSFQSNKLLFHISSNPLSWDQSSHVTKKFKGHTSKVNAVSIAANGEKAISGSNDGTCILWNVSLGKEIKRFYGHGKIVAIAITPDAKMAFSASEMGDCILWDLTTYKIIKTLSDQIDFVSSISITPDGNKAVISSKFIDSCIVWDLENGSIQKQLPGHILGITSVALTADGRRVISGSTDATCILWDLTTGKTIRKLVGHTDEVVSVSITFDGGNAISASRDGTCILWNLATGQKIKIWENVFNGTAISITPDKNKAVFCCGDGLILLNLQTGSKTKMIYANTRGDVSITPDGKNAVSTAIDNSCILWDLSLAKSNTKHNGHTGKINALSVAANGEKALTASSDHTCMIWNLDTEETPKQLIGHTNLVTDVSITKNGKSGASASWDHSCIVWDLIKGEAIRVFKGHTWRVSSILITPDAKKIVSSSDALSDKEDKSFILWNITTGDIIKRFNDHTCFSITADGKKAVAGYIKRIYSGTKKKYFCHLLDMSTGEEIPIANQLQHTGIINAISISADKKFAISASDDHFCKVWNLTDGNILQMLEHDHKVLNISITPNGKYAVSLTVFNLLTVWNLRTGKAIHFFNNVKNFLITPDGSRIISITKDRSSLVIWDLETGRKLALYVSNFLINTIKLARNNIALGDSSGKIVLLGTHKELICPNPQIITIYQIWDFEKKRNQKTTINCLYCGCEFYPSPKIIRSIQKILKENNIQHNDSPCLELPNNVWGNPQLISQCPNCKEKIKFNPFFGSEYKPSKSWKFWKK